MAADNGQQVELFCYERQKANQDIFEEANRFEQALNGHVDPWLHLTWTLVMISAWAVPISIGLGLTIGLALPLKPDAPIYASAVFGVAPALVVLFGVAFLRSISLGYGTFVDQSQGLNLTCEKLRAVLDRTQTCLNYDHKIGLDSLDRPNGSAIAAAAELCGLRMKALQLFQRAFRRLNLLRESCASLRVQSLIVAMGLPVLAALCALSFYLGWIVAPGRDAPPLRPEHGVLGVAVLVAAYIPFLLANGFRTKVVRQLSDVLTENWTMMPSDFDSTGPIMKQYEKTLSDLKICERERRWTPSQLQSARPRDGATGAPLSPIRPDKEEEEDRH